MRSVKAGRSARLRCIDSRTEAADEPCAGICSKLESAHCILTKGVARSEPLLASRPELSADRRPPALRKQKVTLLDSRRRRHRISGRVEKAPMSFPDPTRHSSICLAFILSVNYRIDRACVVRSVSNPDLATLNIALDQLTRWSLFNACSDAMTALTLSIGSLRYRSLSGYGARCCSANALKFGGGTSPATTAQLGQHRTCFVPPEPL